MRDPAVLAVFALRVTAAEFATLASGAPIIRPYWPPVPCRGAVVGLHAGSEVLGEALLSGVVAVAGGAAWTFGAVTLYARRLPPLRPVGWPRRWRRRPRGTLTPARDGEAFT